MSTVRLGVTSAQAEGGEPPPSKLDSRKYGRLLERAAPMVIESEAEYQRMLARLEQLMEKEDASISPEEGRLLKLLAELLEEYEHRNIPLPAVTPDKMLRYLLAEKGLRKSDLRPVLGSKSRVSEIIAGSRSISKSQAKKGRTTEKLHDSQEE